MTDRPDEIVVASEGDHTTDWQLVVTADGVVEARRTVPYDGVRYYSTEERPTSPTANSQFGLTAATVINQFLSVADVDMDRQALRERVADARAGWEVA
jgi:hypothetical protein